MESNTISIIYSISFLYSRHTDSLIYLSDFGLFWHKNCKRYQNCLNEKPDSLISPAKISLADCYIETGEFAKAKAVYEQLPATVENNKNNIHYCQGRIYQEQNDWHSAQLEYESIDDKNFRDKYSNLAKQLGLDVIIAENVQEGIEVALRERPDAIVTDKDMPDGTGSDLARKVKDVYQPPIAGITGGNPNECERI